MQSPSGSSLKNEQTNYISQYTQALETAILSGNNSPVTGYASLLDIDSLIDWFLVEELMKNVDAAFGSSVYLYKDRNAKMKMGPLWDFDLAAGNVDYEPLVMGPTGWYLPVRSAWFEALMRDKSFRQRVKYRWGLAKNQFRSIGGYIDAQEIRLQRSQAENFKRWPILNEWVWPNAVVLGTHQDEVAYLRNWLNKRIKWMDRNIGK